MNVSEEIRDRIRAEELYREEVRNEISSSKKKSRQERIWATLNSPFMMWVLTTLVGTMVVSWYQSKEKERQLEQERRQQAWQMEQKLKQEAKQAEYEITYHVNDAEMALYDYRCQVMANQDPKSDIPTTRELCDLILRKLSGAHTENNALKSSGNPSFASVELQSLINVLYDAGQISKAQKNDMDAGIALIRKKVSDATKLKITEDQEDFRYRINLAADIYGALRLLRSASQTRMFFESAFFSRM